MIEFKRQKFYLDRPGKFGDLEIIYGGSRKRKAYDNNNTADVLHKGHRIFTVSYGGKAVEIMAGNDPVEMDVINECFKQLEFFRGLMMIEQQGKWFIILEGQKIPYVPSMELFLGARGYMLSTPWPERPTW
jgi:hypothetical protein